MVTDGVARDADGVPLKLKSNHQCRLCGRWLEGEWSDARRSGLPGLVEAIQRQMDNGRCDPGHCLRRSSEAKHVPTPWSPPLADEPYITSVDEPAVHAVAGSWIAARVVGPDLPTVWITVIDDTHSGATPYAFTDRDEAIKYARKTAEEYARQPGDIQEETYPDYAYYVRYSPESNAWVVGVRLNAEVPNG